MLGRFVAMGEGGFGQVGVGDGSLVEFEVLPSHLPFLSLITYCPSVPGTPCSTCRAAAPDRRRSAPGTPT